MANGRSQEIVANAAKVQTALKLSQEDQNTIASLKRVRERDTKCSDQAFARRVVPATLRDGSETVVRYRRLLRALQPIRG